MTDPGRSGVAGATPPGVLAFVERAPGSVLLGDVSIPGGGRGEDHDQDRSRASGDPVPRVACVLADVAALRALRPPAGLRSPVVAVHLRDDQGALSLVPPRHWPALTSLRSVPRDAGRWTVLRWRRAVDVADVLHELGRQAVWGDRHGEAGLRVVHADDQPGDHDGDRDDDLPPDVVVGAGSWAPSGLTRHEPLLVRDRRGPTGLLPVDERVVNPVGFLVEAGEPPRTLDQLDLSAGVTTGVVGGLRASRGVEVHRWDRDVAQTVAALAVAGVPVCSADPPVDLLGAEVAAAVRAPVDLTDADAREEHSIVLRRAALDTLSSSAWRRSTARAVGVPFPEQPSVSVVLATRRPEMLDFALAQVSGQRGVESLEVVLATHGFDVSASRVRELVGADVAVRVIAAPADQRFGDVLDAAARASGGDVVLKMDDDDWYAPDAIADLLRARSYSGAELVGMPPEIHYLTEPDLTVRRGHPSELYTRVVAGGTMLVDRAVLREVGGFRSVDRFVDAQLLDDVLAAGGAVYRTHGRGYVLRRNPAGHTWQADLAFLLDPSRTRSQHRGFRPGRLLEVPARWSPEGPAGAPVG